ncbi:MAG: GNAT family N-acetyltransferase [Clostridia bacterium]|nr:GNAT family N-acetyltransferase [Clostridia bacterium]
MTDIANLSSRYEVRELDAFDVDAILRVCRGNPLFYRYCEARPTRGEILGDMTVTPPGVERSAKHYIGFFEERDLVAVMDLIDGYPKEDTAYIGFFMMDARYQGKQIGTEIIREVAACLKADGKTAVRLAIDKGNPQSAHFWLKNGFRIIKEAEVRGWIKLVAERSLREGSAASGEDARPPQTDRIPDA